MSREWYQFYIGESIRSEVIRHIETSSKTMRFMMENSAGAPGVKMIPTSCTEIELREFLERCGAFELLKDVDAQGTVDQTSWPKAFKTTLYYSHKDSTDGTFANATGPLFEFVAQGTFNHVWRVRTPADHEVLHDDVLNKFPSVLRPHVKRGDFVMRLPIPDAPLLTTNEVVSEIENMGMAAIHRYGVLIPLVSVRRHMVLASEHPSMYIDPAMDEPTGERQVPRFQLVAFLQKATMSVADRCARFKRMHIALAKDKFKKSERILANASISKSVEAYFKLLSMAVWGFSAQRCVHIDAKLANFVDTFEVPVDGTALPPLVGNDAKPSGTVRVIDLDVHSFRHLPRTPVRDGSLEHKQNQGWKPIWLSNILFVSCGLKADLPDEIFQVWWNLVEPAIAHVKFELLRDLKHLRDDAEYQTSKRFVEESRWWGRFFYDGTMGKATLGSDPQTVALHAVNNAKFYFHDSPFSNAINKYVKPMLKASTSAERDTARRHFNKYRTKSVPMMRFFAERMGLVEPEKAPLLIDVMLDFCKVDLHELRRRTLLGDQTNQLERHHRVVLTAEEHDVSRLTEPAYVREILGLIF